MALADLITAQNEAANRKTRRHQDLLLAILGLRPRLPFQAGPDHFSALRSVVSDERINGGKHTPIPTVFRGQPLPVGRAIEMVVQAGGRDPQTGEPLPGFDTPEEAEAFSRRRSKGAMRILNGAR